MSNAATNISPAPWFSRVAPFQKWITDHPLLFLGGVFVVSRLVYWLLGVRYLLDLQGMMQLSDPSVLQTHFWEAIFYLHSQPHLLNFLMGLGFALFPSAPVNSFWHLFMGMGIVLVILMYEIMV